MSRRRKRASTFCVEFDEDLIVLPITHVNPSAMLKEGKLKHIMAILDDIKEDQKRKPAE